ncbi:MAG TPA: glycosyltransferase [Albitalea sp.]|nr:glycosyltransferase [Albitalea sp.]
MPHLIVFSHLRWNFVYQRPQHLLTRLAKHYKVLFVEEPIRADGPPRLASSEVAAGVTVLEPMTPVDAAGFHDDQLPTLRPLVADYLREHGIDDYVVWFYTPMALPLLAELTRPGASCAAPRAVVYDCMDELSAFKGAPRQLRQREAALMKAAQLVLTGGPSLYEAKRALHPNVLCLPSAVDAQHYAPHVATAKIDLMLQAEQIQGRIPGPRLGFFGVIDERLDIELVGALADARPDWQIVMVGPVVKIAPSQLPRRPNIHWLGQQPYALLPQLVADWDVCLLPFALNESTRFISPTKTLEYMAAEKPVVSTAVADVVGMYGDVVRIGRSHASFIEACASALSETGFKRAERINEMLATVSRYSWDSTAKCVHEAIEQVLAELPPQEQPIQEGLATLGNLALAAPLPAPLATSVRTPLRARRPLAKAG